MDLETLISHTDDRPAVSGTVESVVYRNADNDYTVMEFMTDQGTSVTCTGCMPDIVKGETLIVFGDWSYHVTYGLQFAVESYRKTIPTETEDILKYLSSGVIKGIGPVTALKIVNRFGADTFDVIENHPTWLSDIPGISRKKAAEMTATFRSQSGLRKLMMCCRDFLGSSSIARVYKEWGDDAAKVIEDNPYRLCDEIYGISFERADKLAQKLGVVPDSEFRVTSGFRYVLNVQAGQNGHTCLPRETLIDSASEHLGIARERVTEVLDHLIATGHMKTRVQGENTLVFTPETDRAEEFVARKLKELSENCEILSDREIDRLIAMTESEGDIRFAALQKQAIRDAFAGGVMILTGGPGTGKTTVVRALIRISEHMNLKTSLAAPTGRAAKRMSEATGHEAKTVHRLLEMDKTNDQDRYHFKRNSANPLEEKVIIIDEASMIDLPLMEGLLRATLRGTRIVFIGDDHQLPPVGIGNVFRDMISSGQFHTVCLTEIFRQSESSMIVVNAHRIYQGELPLLHTKNDDSFFMARSDDDQIVETIDQLLTTRLPRAYGQDVLGKIQVITPSRKGKAGTENLNRILKEHLNPPAPGKREWKYRDTVFREGDKIMQIRNDYDVEWEKDDRKGMGIYNGDIGTILSIDPDGDRIEIVFEDKKTVYDNSMLEEIEHAYAITVHKSQGSEYPIVIIPLYNCAPMLRTRNLFYTALTRAREMVIMVGSERVAQDMVDNDFHTMRYSALEDRLRGVAL